MDETPAIFWISITSRRIKHPERLGLEGGSWRSVEEALAPLECTPLPQMALVKSNPICTEDPSSSFLSATDSMWQSRSAF